MPVVSVVCQNRSLRDRSALRGAQAGLQISRMPIGFGELSDSVVRWRWKMDGTVIPANCVERPIPF